MRDPRYRRVDVHEKMRPKNSDSDSDGVALASMATGLYSGEALPRTAQSMARKSTVFGLGPDTDVLWITCFILGCDEPGVPFSLGDDAKFGTRNALKGTSRGFVALSSSSPPTVPFADNAPSTFPG